MPSEIFDERDASLERLAVVVAMLAQEVECYAALSRQAGDTATMAVRGELARCGFVEG